MNIHQNVSSLVGNTPLLRINALNVGNDNILLAKLEGQNPAGSVKDRPALSMISHAETQGNIQPGDRLVEATSGNTGIALAMMAAIKGYHMILIMPANSSLERQKAMKAFGAELLLVPEEAGMEGARDMAMEMHQTGQAKLLNQFANQDNPLAHFESTAQEIWRDTQGQVTHFVSSMGTTGTIMGTSKYLKQHNTNIQIIGVQPDGVSKIPGIRRWPEAYLPKIYDPKRVDRIIDVNEQNAIDTMKRLAKEQGLFAGPSSGGAMYAALQLAKHVHNAVIVTIVCDRGDRYLSTDVFD